MIDHAPVDRPVGNAARRWPAWLMPSLADVVFLCTLLMVLMQTGPLLSSDGDTARHVAIGRDILMDRQIPREDYFSHTRAGEPFVAYEWLSEVAFGLAHALGGLPGVSALAAILIAIPFYLLTRWMVRDGVNFFVTLLLVATGALAASVHWLARPHLFSILLTLLWARSLYRYQETGNHRYLLWLPVSMALWTNLHPGFLSGFILLGAFLLSNLGTRSRAFSIAVSALSSLVLTGVNPFGYGLWTYVLGYLQLKPFLDTISEFQSPSFHTLSGQLFLGILLLGIASMAITPSRIRKPSDLLLLVTWMSLGLFSVRNIALFVVVCLPIIGRLVDAALHEAQAGKLGFYSRAANLGVAALELGRRLTVVERGMGRPLWPLAVAALVWYGLTGGSLTPTGASSFDSRAFPVEALSRADTVGAGGNLFNYYLWGGYVLYARPDYRVFVDGQTDHYGLDLVSDYRRIWQLSPEWKMLLDSYRVDWVLIPHQSSLSLMLAGTEEWKLAYQDATADIFLRDGAHGE